MTIYLNLIIARVFIQFCTWFSYLSIRSDRDSVGIIFIKWSLVEGLLTHLLSPEFLHVKIISGVRILCYRVYWEQFDMFRCQVLLLIETDFVRCSVTTGWYFQDNTQDFCRKFFYCNGRWMILIMRKVGWKGVTPFVFEDVTIRGRWKFIGSWRYFVATDGVRVIGIPILLFGLLGW